MMLKGSSLPPWIKWTSLVCLVLGGVLFAIAAIQLFTEVELLDEPMSGGIGLWLIGYTLVLLGHRKAASAKKEDTA